MGTELISIDAHDTYKLPKEPGLYFIFKDVTLVYIGKAKNLRARFENHHIIVRLDDMGELDCCKIKYKMVEGDLEIRERRLIGYFKPFLNQVHKW